MYNQFHFNTFHATSLFLHSPENIWKPLIFWCFQGVYKENSADNIKGDGLNLLRLICNNNNPTAIICLQRQRITTALLSETLA